MLDSQRAISEDLVIIREWFDRLKEVIDDYGIQPEDLWNMDETGFQIGYRKQGFCVSKKRKARPIAIPTNRETATAVEAISAAGRVIEPFLILKGKCQIGRWHTT